MTSTEQAIAILREKDGHRDRSTEISHIITGDREIKRR